METLIRCPFHPVLPQWHEKDPGHSARSAGGRLHFNTHISLTQRSWRGLTMLSRRNVTTYQENELTGNSSGNTHPTDVSQFAEPLLTDTWPKQWNSFARANLLLKIKSRKAQAGNKSSNLPVESSQARRKTPEARAPRCFFVFFYRAFGMSVIYAFRNWVKTYNMGFFLGDYFSSICRQQIPSPLLLVNMFQSATSQTFLSTP